MMAMIKDWLTRGRLMRTGVLGVVLLGLVLSWQGSDVGEFGGIILSCVAASFTFMVIYFIIWLVALAFIHLRDRLVPGESISRG